MFKKREIITFALFAFGACGIHAQQQTVSDNRGKTMQVYIPQAEEKDYEIEVEYSNTKFYKQQNNGYGSHNSAETEDEAATISHLLSRVSGAMQLTYHPEVQKYIDRYIKQGRRSTSCLLARADYYNPIFEEALRHYGLPLELKNLPVIESGLNPKAISGKGAAGLWQLMPATGKQYNLKINNYVDERLDPIKSSYAAAKLLGDLYQRFGDWTLALAAYNCGPTRVSVAIEKAGGASDFWQIYEYLPKETRGYVPAFIAANFVMNYHADYNIMPESTGLPEQIGKVVVTEDIPLAKIANLVDMDLADLKTLNPQYRQGIVKTIDGSATILLLAEKVKRFTDNAISLTQNNEIKDKQPTDIAAKIVGKQQHRTNS